METYKNVIDTIAKHRKSMEESEFWAYLNKVYKFCKDLQPGQSYTIYSITNDDTRPLFIAVIKMYICDIDNAIEFSNDYSSVRRINFNN